MTYEDVKAEEIKKRVILVATCAKETGFSTRQLASFISEHYFPISNATVHSYLQQRLPKIDPELYQEVSKIIQENRAKTVDNEIVFNRIKKVINLLLEGYTVPMIVEILNEDTENQYGTITVYTIYNDLNLRLRKIVDDDIFLENIKKILERNSFLNLNNQDVTVANFIPFTQITDGTMVYNSEGIEGKNKRTKSK